MTMTDTAITRAILASLSRAYDQAHRSQDKAWHDYQRYARRFGYFHRSTNAKREVWHATDRVRHEAFMAYCAASDAYLAR